MVIDVLGHYGFNDVYIGNILDDVFNQYLWAQHENDSNDFQEAQSYHYTIIQIKKLLSAIAAPAKEASKKEK